MKKIKIVVTAIVLIVAGLAITPQMVNATTPPPDEDNLYWYHASDNSDAGENTLTDEVPDSGCPNEGQLLCEKGYRADQFVISGDRSSGVKPAQVNNFVPIYKID